MRGEWYELRDAPNTRGIVQGLSEDLLVILQLSGDEDVTAVALREFEERWEPMRFEGKPALPYWVKRGAEFTPIPCDIPHISAVIEDTRPGWVAYHVQFNRQYTADRASLFFMEPWWQFHENYRPIRNPSAWDRLLHEDD